MFSISCSDERQTLQRRSRRGSARVVFTIVVAAIAASACTTQFEVLRSPPDAERPDAPAIDGTPPIDATEAAPTTDALAQDGSDACCANDAAHDAPDDTGADEAPADAATCGLENCDPGEVCCEHNGLCFPPGCVACCEPIAVDSGAHCLTAGCPSDQRCCPRTGLCYHPICLTCCL